MQKTLNEVQVGDLITHMGDKAFDSTLEVTKVDRYKKDVVLVVLAATGAHGGLSPFWPMQPGRRGSDDDHGDGMNYLPCEIDDDVDAVDLTALLKASLAERGIETAALKANDRVISVSHQHRGETGVITEATRGPGDPCYMVDFGGTVQMMFAEELEVLS